MGPAVLDVLASWPKVRDLDPLLLQGILLAQAAAFACFWVILRITLRLREWLPVITSQLASNAAARIVPGGGAAGNALQYSMLVRAGVPGPTVASGLTAASLLTMGIVFALPALALPAVLGGAGIDRSLARAAWAGAAALVLLLAAGALLLFADAPLRVTGRLAQRVVNRVRRKRPPATGLPERLLGERDLIRDVLSSHWFVALLATLGRWAFDYASLLLALLAVGARPAPTAVLLAFCTAQALSLVPLTPGGPGVRRGRADRDAGARGRGLGRRGRRDARLPAGGLLGAAAARRHRLGGAPPRVRRARDWPTRRRRREGSAAREVALQRGGDLGHPARKVALVDTGGGVGDHDLAVGLALRAAQQHVPALALERLPPDRHDVVGVADAALVQPGVGRGCAAREHNPSLAARGTRPPTGRTVSARDAHPTAGHRRASLRRDRCCGTR